MKVSELMALMNGMHLMLAWENKNVFLSRKLYNIQMKVIKYCENRFNCNGDVLKQHLRDLRQVTCLF